MKPDLDELVEQWTLDGHRPSAKHIIPASPLADASFKDVLLQLEYFGEKRFSRFVPALFPPHTPNFRDRLLNWITNQGLTDEQQRLLFEFALRLSFFSFEDFLQLYRNAFLGQVSRWIIDELHLSLDQADFDEHLICERQQRTWYCPVTDSMVISEFYHANRITGIDQRPAFRSLKQFCDPALLTSYMNSKGLKRLVLLEDFVGSGTQTREVVEWAVDGLACPVLFVPLIICPDGLAAFVELASKYPSRLKVEPVLTLDEDSFVFPRGGTNDPLYKKVADMAERVHPIIAGSPDSSYGFKGFHAPGDSMLGATVVLFSNTPDNSLPLIHYHSHPPSNWQALFPRVSREI
jgi:hypothetical protein